MGKRGRGPRADAAPERKGYAWDWANGGLVAPSFAIAYGLVLVVIGHGVTSDGMCDSGEVTLVRMLWWLGVAITVVFAIQAARMWRDRQALQVVLYVFGALILAGGIVAGAPIVTAEGLGRGGCG
jgi:hypothetical protein